MESALIVTPLSSSGFPAVVIFYFERRGRLKRGESLVNRDDVKEGKRGIEVTLLP